MSNHVGTHIDVPYHFAGDGKRIDEYDAHEWVCGHVQLIELSLNEGELIYPEKWTDQIRGDTEMILLKTHFEQRRAEQSYWATNPGLTPQLGQWLKSHRPAVRFVGMDFISATSYLHRPLGKETHQSFLTDLGGPPIMLIEDMKLSEVTSDPSSVIVLPLRVKGSDGGPVTVIARTQPEVGL